MPPPSAEAGADADPDRTLAQPDLQAGAASIPAVELPGDRLPDGATVGNYVIEGLIGKGGFGIVYRARDRALGRIVAVKEFYPSSLVSRGRASDVSVNSEAQRKTFEIGLRSFVNEARLLARFEHPALVEVHHFWQEHNTAYMAMPFYEGPTLRQALGVPTPPPDEAWLGRLLLKILDALTLLHRNQCIHRDVSPDNILLTRSGPVLLDFGAARRVISDATQNLTVILRPGYAPIEQYDEIPGMKQGPWTDLYALAAVVHFAIVGKAPAPALSRALGDGERVPLQIALQDRYGERFLALIERALSPRPEDRPQSTDEFRQLLLDAVPGIAPEPADSTRVNPASAAAPKPTPKTFAAPIRARTQVAAPAPRRRIALPGFVAGIAVVAVAAGVAGVYLGAGRERAREAPRPPAAAIVPPAPVAAPVVERPLPAPPASTAPAPPEMPAAAPEPAPPHTPRPPQHPSRSAPSTAAPRSTPVATAQPAPQPSPPLPEAPHTAAPSEIDAHLREAATCLARHEMKCATQNAETVLQIDRNNAKAQEILQDIVRQQPFDIK